MNASLSIEAMLFSLKSILFNPRTCLNACDLIPVIPPLVICRSSSSTPNSSKSSGPRALELIRDSERDLILRSLVRLFAIINKCSFKQFEESYFLNDWRLLGSLFPPLKSSFSRVYCTALNISIGVFIFTLLSRRLRTLLYNIH